MDLYSVAVIILLGLAISDLIVGVSNDAVNFLNSPIGSRAAPRYIIMIIASLGILLGVTFSSGMMEVARKGIFHPEYFLMPELMTMFLAVMLTDVLLLDVFNTFGLPTSTTVSLVFELLGAAVAVSLIKIFNAGNSLADLMLYINTAKALMIIMGILLSVLIAFTFGAITQFLTRMLFTFDYQKRMKRYGGLWGGMALSIIAYFILKGSKGASFLSPQAIDWINTHTWTLLFVNFGVFAAIFQSLSLFIHLNIFKPVILVGTFALAMAFAANDLVNFVGVPLAGLNAYEFAKLSGDPLNVTMEAMKQPVQSKTYQLLIAGIIMVLTLWFSKKSRTVSQTELSLGRQDEGMERFGASTLSRIIVRMAYGLFQVINSIIPAFIKRKISQRLDTSSYSSAAAEYGKAPSFDLLRAAVNLVVASAVISVGTSLKLPLSTTYVTFMVAMGSSLADQAWGRESAVYRVTGVLTVIGGWFFTAVAAFSVAMVFASAIYYLKLYGLVGVMGLVGILILNSFRYHHKKTQETQKVEAFSMKNVENSDEAIATTFHQTGLFLKEISDTLSLCIEATFSEDRQKLKDVFSQTEKIQTWGDVIVGNIFKTLFLLHKEDMDSAQTYAHTIRSLQSISHSHRDLVLRIKEHFDNYHSGFQKDQEDELRQIKTNVNRLLWNTSIMLLNRKKVDYDYIENQCGKLNALIDEFDRNQIRRIQTGEGKTRLSILYYGILENSQEIAEETKNLLNIFRDSFRLKEGDSREETGFQEII
ncbi:MAG: inorganic phosphate transporter [Desulfobacteraceae bacterium]|nr:inorganic phosphate transporter [Desulfobacteraceae bacterium]